MKPTPWLLSLIAACVFFACATVGVVRPKPPRRPISWRDAGFTFLVLAYLLYLLA